MRLLGLPLGLGLLGRLVLATLQQLFPFILPLPFLVDWISLEGLGGWRSGEPGLRSFSRCIVPQLRL